MPKEAPIAHAEALRIAQLEPLAMTTEERGLLLRYIEERQKFEAKASRYLHEIEERFRDAHGFVKAVKGVRGLSRYAGETLERFVDEQLVIYDACAMASWDFFHPREQAQKADEANQGPPTPKDG